MKYFKHTYTVDGQ